MIASVTAVVLAAASGDWSYVTAAYVLTVVVLIVYAAWVIRRGRRVGRQLRPEDRRWM